MLIIIKSVEAGWETERQIELPENEGLVKAILRSVKKCGQSRAAESVKEVEAANESSHLDPGPPATPADKAPEVVPLERTVFKEPKYRGFILYRCQVCGKAYAINAHDPVSSVECKGCGSKVNLHDVVVAELQCPQCGRVWKYQTNEVGADVFVGCIQCGTKMHGEWNAKCRRYVTK